MRYSARFLSFSEAREYTRSLQLDGFKDWRTFAKSAERPTNIPSDPRQVYQTEFVDYGDWLNGKRTRFRAIAADLVATSCSSIIVSQSQGLSLFKDYVQKHAPEYKLSALPKEVSATFFLERRDQASESCTILEVHFARRRDGKTDFSGLHRQKHTIARIGFEISESQLFSFPADDFSLPRSISFRTTNTNHDKYKMDGSAMRTILQQHWERQVHLTKKEWLLNHLFKAENDRTWAKNLLKVQELIYDPLSISYCFPIRKLETVENVILDGVPILHRAATYSNGLHQIWLDKIVNGMRVPIYDHDNVRFVVVSIRDRMEDTLTGIYVLPRSVLDEHKLIRDPRLKIHRSRTMQLFPPWAIPRYAGGRKKQLWQNEYYLDLSNDTVIEESRLKFSQIFGEHRR